MNRKTTYTGYNNSSSFSRSGRVHQTGNSSYGSFYQNASSRPLSSRSRPVSKSKYTTEKTIKKTGIAATAGFKSTTAKPQVPAGMRTMKPPGKNDDTLSWEPRPKPSDKKTIPHKRTVATTSHSATTSTKYTSTTTTTTNPITAGVTSPKVTSSHPVEKRLSDDEKRRTNKTTTSHDANTTTTNAKPTGPTTTTTTNNTVTGSVLSPKVTTSSQFAGKRPSDDSKSLSQSHSSVTGADNIKKDDGSYKSGGGGGGVVPTPLLATMQDKTAANKTTNTTTSYTTTTTQSTGPTSATTSTISSVPSPKVNSSSQKAITTVSQSPTQPSSSDANTTTNSKDDSKLPNSGSWVGTGVGTKGTSTPVEQHPYRSASRSPMYGGSGYGSIGRSRDGFTQYLRNPVDSTTVQKPVTKPIKGLANYGNTCYCNALLQNLAVLMTLYNMLKEANSSNSRTYHIDGGTVAEPLTVTVNKSAGHLTSTLYNFLNGYRNSLPDPRPVLAGVRHKVNSRFGGGTQQDSHELFRCLLDGMRTEESELIFKAVEQKLGTTSDGETKLKKRAYRRNIKTHVDDVFGGAICSTVVCRKCLHVSQVKEPFLDLSLPIVDSQAGRTSTYNFNKRPRDDDKEEAKTFNGVFQLLKRNGDKDIALPMDSERSHNGRCNIVNCLNEYTDLEVMDSDNMFICTECNKRESMKQDAMGNNRIDDGPVLSLVSKLLLIDQLPQLLVLHLKRFSLGQYVRKNSKHVDFPVTLNMRKYCTVNCQPITFDYKLKGVVSHSGSLHGGHYIAYVCNGEQWYYISDSHVSSVGKDRVLSCEAYMLFYEQNFT
ncbi:ubiquitin carboxyl-terminal hydrolase 45-like isoform X2 [Dysidea avara]|uniref:ubiquitin carboxyl-terminal hydrolase 45-like isoform X2 n=1 Tax=Dysidea avara TaxID=196820 RepID=UPI00332BB26E